MYIIVYRTSVALVDICFTFYGLTLSWFLLTLLVCSPHRNAHEGEPWFSLYVLVNLIVI